MQDHTRYPNCVRFSPDGTKAISVGADRQIIVWDAKEGTKINEIGLANAAQNHTMSILSFSWSPDSKQILTSSMDGSAKLWNVDSGSVVHTWKFGAEKEIAHQQVGTLWVDQWVLSVGLNGMIHHLDIETGNVIKTVHGHQGNITGLAVSEGRIWTSDTQGTLLNVNGKTHVQYTGDGHNKV
jgi:WD40 repeat protein